MRSAARCTPSFAIVVIAFALTSVGFALAWKMDSTAGYHGVMMLGLMPMLMLSGAFFPASGAHPILKVVMAANPLGYGVAWLRRAFYGDDLTLEIPSVGLAAGVSVGFALAAFLLAVRVVRARSARDALT